MSDNKDAPRSAVELRRLAEARTSADSAQTQKNFEALSPIELRQLFHELQVHQIELEMQNEELRRAHVELDMSRSLYFDIYELAPVGYVTVNERGMILMANLSAARLLGVGRSKLPRRVLNSFVCLDDLANHLAHTKRLFATGEQQSYELRMVRADGRQFWAQLEAAIGKNANGEPVSRLVINDINERKVAEIAVKKSEERHRTILHAAMDGFFIADTEGRLLEVNPAYCRMLGFSAKELLTKRLPDLDCVEGGESVMTWIPRVMVQGKERRETWQRCSDGRLLQVEMSAQYDPENGGQLVVFLRDLSERKRAAAEREKLREQVNQGEKLASVGRLASGIAQDFINMLDVISSEVETALLVAGKKEPLHSSLETIAHAAKRSTQITQQLLAFASKQSATPKVVNANDLIASLLPMLRAICGPNFGLSWKPDAALWPVYLDPSHLDQIVVSLCINSRAALAPGGEVSITTGNRSVAAHDKENDILPGDYVTLTVTDNGCGMDAETKSHMFDPFFAMKEMGAGTGLGLATAYGIIQQNNGFIQVESEPGEGTSITVLLPRFAGSAANADSAELIFSARGHETILLVEDEPLVLKVTARMLSAQGYHVLAASSPAEAIRLASECGERTPLLITDVLMPTIDGKQLASILRQRYPEMKILYVSGYSKEVLASHGVRQEDGINFEQKPYSMKDLSTKIRSVLDG